MGTLQKGVLAVALAVAVSMGASSVGADEAIDVEALSCPRVEPVKIDVNYGSAVTLRQIASEIVAQWGLRTGPLDAIPEDGARTFFWVLDASLALNILARDEDWTWYRDGDTVRFAKRDDPVLRTERPVATHFEIQATRAGAGLEMTIISDLPDRQPVRVQIDRNYFQSGNPEAYSRGYGKYCGLAAQWRTPKRLPLNNDAWLEDLIAHQDQMALLGDDMAFEIDEVSDHVGISARADSNSTETLVLLPLTVSVRSQSDIVGGDYLRIWESYEVLAPAPLLPRMSVLDEKGRQLIAGEIFHVEAIDRSGTEPWYLVSVGDRWGWINSIALLSEGVRRVATLTDDERQAAKLRESLMDNVFNPCLEYAYDKLVRGSGANEHFARMAMVESIQPTLNDVIIELLTLGLDDVPAGAIRGFHQDALANCKAGVGR